jgi:hypothetical protein
MTTAIGFAPYDTRTMFNSTIYNILNGDSNNACYIEFIELCIFYQKTNEHNTGVLKQLSDAVCSKYNFVEEVNNALKELNWDNEDECLYRFMTSFINL